MLRMKTEFSSQGSIQLLGIKPEDLTSYHFKEATHPDDLKRHELGLIQFFKIAHELFVAKKVKCCCHQISGCEISLETMSISLSSAIFSTALSL